MAMTKGTKQNGSQQRLDEWKAFDEDGYRYHQVQWETPKQSTLAFESFTSQHISTSKNIIDLGAGGGLQLHSSQINTTLLTLQLLIIRMS